MGFSTPPSARSCRSLLQTQEPLRVRSCNLLDRGRAEARLLEGGERAAVAEGERVVGAEHDLVLAEGLGEEADRRGIEDQVVVVEAPRGGRRRLAQRLLSLRKRVPGVLEAGEQDGH